MWTAVGSAVFVIILVAGPLATFFTELWWYQDMGQPDVFWTVLLSKITIGLVFALISFGILYTSVVIARRMAPPLPLDPAVMDGVPLDGRAQIQAGLAQARRAIEPYVRWVAFGVCGFVAWGSGAAMAEEWQTLRLALTGVSFGSVDAQFGRDISYFVFTLPAQRLLCDWTFGVLMTTLVLTILVHLYDGAIRPWEKLEGFEPHVKAHLSVLLGLLVATKAYDYWLSIYELDFSPRGQVLGASYTDVNAQIPAYWILIVIAIVSFVILMTNIRVKGWRLPLIALGVWVGASIVVGAIYPAIVQQFVVNPNELAAEAPYIERNIAATRAAFDLDTIEGRPFAAANDLTARDLIESTTTIANVRMWDPNVVIDSYKQLQEIRFYYDFKDVDIDRYTIDGVLRQVLISAREMNVDQLSDQAQTWVNRHLIYTHGYGVVMSPVNESTGDGLPNFIVRDLPPRTSTDITITQPAIYFGEESNTYAVVDTTQKEFDYPEGQANATTRYKGKGGVPVGGFLGRLAFALRFGDGEVLFSTAIKPASRVLYRRDLTDRIGELAPWLVLDQDPYPVVTKTGRVVWVVDGYTHTSYYPYSERQGSGDVNYIRNSVKVTVDAYDGTTTFYAFDEKDPMLAAYRSLFPTLVRPRKELPRDIEDHLRYPEDLFALQAQAYSTYHMTDPQVFYNKEDQWTIPGEATGDPMAPYYLLMALPGETEQSFLLMQPYTPRTKDNMISWVAAKSDPGVYGDRVVYAFPKQRLILGPSQIKARINQEPEISRNLTLLNQQGSRVIHGNLLVIPIKDSIVYIEPVYIQAEQSPMPEIKYVVVAYDDKVVMAPDLATALVQVFGAAPASAGDATPGGSRDGTATVQPGGGTAGTDGGGTGGTGGTGSRIDARNARDLFERAIKAQRAGDWATYGKLMDQLGDELQRIASDESSRSK